MKRSNHKFFSGIIYSFNLLFLSACGGGGGSDAGGGDTLSVGTSLVPLTCNSTEPEIQLGVVPDIPSGNPDAGKGVFFSTKTESGTNGIITYDCVTEDYGMSGSTFLEITQVNRTVTFVSMCDGLPHGKVTAVADYAAGTQNKIIEVEGTTVQNCQETYTSPVPDIITDPASLPDLATVFTSPSDPSLLTNNCPAGIPTVEAPALTACTTVVLADFEATDSVGSKHLVSIKTTLTISLR